MTTVDRPDKKQYGKPVFQHENNGQPIPMNTGMNYGNPTPSTPTLDSHLTSFEVVCKDPDQE